MGRLNISLPSLGEGIVEASIIRLLKNIGDKVDEDDAIVEIATDKVDTEIVAPEKGVIEDIVVKPGDIVKVGEVVVVLSTEKLSEEYSPSVMGPEGEESFVLNKSSLDKSSEKEIGKAKKGSRKNESPDINKEKPESSDESPIQEAVSHSGSRKKRFLSPLVKKIMKDEGVSVEEVSTLKGSGYMGRITRDDILGYAKHKKEGLINAEELKEITVSSSVSREDVHAAKDRSGELSGKDIGEESLQEKERELGFAEKDATKTSEFTEKEMDRVRMLIAAHTLESKKLAPHVTSFAEVDVSNFQRIREVNKERFMNDYGVKLTYTPLFIKATAMALEKFPEINSSLVGNKIRYYNNINIGIATSLTDGNLIVPVIKGVENLNIRGIASSLVELTNKARTNNLDPSDITGGTFTITNFGSFSTMAGTPIIVQPQSAILGIGEIKKRVVVQESQSGDSLAIRPISIISISFDHRIIDGALAGNFLGYLRDCIENLRL